MSYPPATILVPFLHGRGFCVGDSLPSGTGRRYANANESTITTLVIFDSQVADLPLLYTALLPGSIDHTIQPNQDPIDHITHLLTQTGATKLAIVAHGQPGVIQIGNGKLDLAMLEARSGLLQEWGVKEIALYSCEVSVDKGFIQRLGELTGARIAATTEKVGAGHWDLDGGVGLLEIDRLTNYSSTLAIFNGTTGNDGADADGVPLFFLPPFINGFTGGTVAELTDGSGDTFYGGDGNDYVDAGSGDDFLNGGNGDDFLNGGNGDDFLDGSVGTNTLYGGNGNDSINVGLLRGTFDGGSGLDYLTINTTAPSSVDAYNVIFTGTNAGKLQINGADTGTFTGIEQLGFIGGTNGNDVVNASLANLVDINPGAGSMYGLSIGSGSGSDTVLGSANADAIYGENDNDFLYGQGGDDVISGGTGFDIIFGGSGIDTINGDSQNDTIFGQIGDDTINGGDGEDYLYGEDGDDTIFGVNGFDVIYGQAGIDTINGGGLNDTIFGGTEGDFINGNDGEDYLFGEDGDDTIRGGYGFDVIYGQAGNDSIFGEGDSFGSGGVLGGNDITFAPAAGVGINDTIFGGIGNDRINGGIGNDVLLGEADDDYLFGGVGDDYLYGGTGNDTLDGAAENDFLDGGAGNDTLYGRDGSDTIFGVEGDDFIYGRAGNDFLIGGAGSDTFYYFAMTDAGDTIADFNPAVGGDKLDFTYLFANLSPVVPPGMAVSTDYLRFLQVGTSTLVQIDPDGLPNPTNVFTTMATLSNVTASSLIPTFNVIV